MCYNDTHVYACMRMMTCDNWQQIFLCSVQEFLRGFFPSNIMFVDVCLFQEMSKIATKNLKLSEWAIYVD